LLTFSGDYGFNKFLSTAAGFRTIFVADRESRIHTRFRIHADGVGQYAVSQFDFSFRLRFQYGFEDLFFVGYIAETSFISRQKLKVDYDIFGTRMDLFTSLENWVNFADQNGQSLSKVRLTLGGSYDLNFRSSLSIRYLFENEFNGVNPYHYHIIALGYSYDL
jgi:hypothetical protein